MLSPYVIQRPQSQHKVLQQIEFVADSLWQAKFKFVVQCKELKKKKWSLSWCDIELSLLTLIFEKFFHINIYNSKEKKKGIVYRVLANYSIGCLWAEPLHHLDVVQLWSLDSWQSCLLMITMIRNILKLAISKNFMGCRWHLIYALNHLRTINLGVCFRDVSTLLSACLSCNKRMWMWLSSRKKAKQILLCLHCALVSKFILAF